MCFFSPYIAVVPCVTRSFAKLAKDINGIFSFLVALALYHNDILFFRDALKSRSFKKQLPVFLAKEWQDPSYANIFENCSIILDIPGECYEFCIKDGVIQRRKVMPELEKQS